MTTTHLALRYAHITMGMLALLAGAASMMLAKGSQAHRQAGTVFFISMLAMAGSGAFISAFINLDRANIMGGMLALYLVFTAWATVWRSPGRTGSLELGGSALGFTTAAIGGAFAMQAATSDTGTIDGFPPQFFMIFGGVALLGALGDARMVQRGGFTGSKRTVRHLWRMLAAMFIATASFFLGQVKLFPAGVQQSGVLALPVLLVIGALAYWLIRLRALPAVRRMRIATHS